MNNSSNIQEKNVFRQLAEMFNGFFSSGAERSGTYYDDVVRYVRVPLFITALTRFVSYTFALRVFLDWLDEPYCTAVASLAALCLEATIMLLGFAFAKGITKRQTYFDVVTFFIVVFLLVGTGFALRWGYSISTEGQKQIAVIFNLKKKNAPDSTTTLLNQNLAAADEQLQSLNAEKQKGLNQTWRKKITWEGTVLARNAQKNEGEVLKQKTMLLEHSLKRDSALNAQLAYQTEVKAHWTGIFGGNLEYISIFCVLIMGFCAAKIEAIDENEEITVITGNYQLQAGKIVIDGKEYDRTKASQWLKNCIARSKDQSKTQQQRDYFLARAVQLKEAIDEYDKAYNVGHKGVGHVTV